MTAQIIGSAVASIEASINGGQIQNVQPFGEYTIETGGWQFNGSSTLTLTMNFDPMLNGINCGIFLDVALKKESNCDEVWGTTLGLLNAPDGYVNPSGPGNTYLPITWDIPIPTNDQKYILVYSISGTNDCQYIESHAGQSNLVFLPDCKDDIIINTDMSPDLNISFANFGLSSSNYYDVCSTEGLVLDIQNPVYVNNWTLEVSKLFSPFTSCTTITGTTILPSELTIPESSFCSNSASGGVQYGLPGGSYEIRLTYVDMNSDLKTWSKDISRNTTPSTITLGQSYYHSCEGIPVNMSASGNGNLTWTPNVGSNVLYGNNVTTGNISQNRTYTISSNAYCVANTDVDVYYNYKPIIDLINTNPLTICSDQVPYSVQKAITENGVPSAGGSYSWTGQCLTNTNASSAIFGAGNCSEGNRTVNLTYTSSAGCQSDQATWNFTYNTLDVTIAQSNFVCTGGGNTPTATLTATGTGGNSNNYTFTWSAGVNGSGATGTFTANGNYSVTIDDGVCSNAATIPIANAPNVLSITTANITSQPDCQSSSTINNTGSAQVSFTGGSGQVTRSVTSTHPSYSASNAFPLNVPSPFTISNLIAEYTVPHSYFITLQDANGCTVQHTLNGVQAQNEMSASSSVLDATCEGKDGEITLTFSASNGGPYTISGALSGSTSNTTFQTSKPAGFYGPIYVSNGTCNDVTSATIENTYEPNDLYDPNLTLGQGAACIGVANGSLNTNMAYATGAPNTSASPSWLYAWSDGQTTSNATNLLSGGYNVTITDNSSYSFVTGPNLHGCIISKSASVPNIGTSSWQEHTNPYNLGDNSNITSMAIDDQENVYVAGIFEGELNIQGQTATTSPNSINEFFVAAFNSCGILKWLNYSEGTSYDFDDIQITENGGRIYLANLPATGNPSTGTLILNDGFGNPVPMPSFNIENDGLGLIEFNAIVGSVNSVSHFFNNPYITLSSDLMDLEVGNKIYIAGKFNNKARVLELNTQSNSVLLVLEDANTGNIFHDLELGNNDDLYLVGQVLSQPMILNTSDVQPIGTSDAIIAFHNSTTTFVRSIKASNAGEATGLSLLDNGQMAVVGNYSGSIGSYLGGSIYAPTNSSTGFIANFAQTNTLDLEWLASLEAPGTQPNWNNNVTYAHCTDVSSNENNEVFVFGSFEGTSFELEANSMNYSTPGATGLESMWNGKFGGFTSTANMSIDWLTSASSPVATPVDIVSGLYNNYIAGDFTDHIAVGGSPLMSTQNPNAESSYIIRFGDQLNPQQGAYYKMDDSSEEMANNDFSLYPNPNSGILNLTWTAGEGTMEFTITDITGRLVYQSNKTNAELGTSSIDISNFDSGTYYISFQLEGNATVKPFIKL